MYLSKPSAISRLFCKEASPSGAFPDASCNEKMWMRGLPKIMNHKTFLYFP